MKWLTKGLAVLLVACLILGAVGCAGEKTKQIKVGVIGPMEFQMGKHHWMGATLGACPSKLSFVFMEGSNI